MALDIDERHLLRLGHGEEELQTEKDFSRSEDTLYIHTYSTCTCITNVRPLYYRAIYTYAVCVCTCTCILVHVDACTCTVCVSHLLVSDRFGRVNFILALRLELLKEVERLKVMFSYIMFIQQMKYICMQVA